MGRGVNTFSSIKESSFSLFFFLYGGSTRTNDSEIDRACAIHPSFVVWACVCRQPGSHMYRHGERGDRVALAYLWPCVSSWCGASCCCMPPPSVRTGGSACIIDRPSKPGPSVHGERGERENLRAAPRLSPQRRTR